MLREELPIALSATLIPAIGVHEEAGSRLTVADRHRQGLVHEFCPHMGSHRRPDDRTRAQIEYDGEIQPAFACGEIGYIPT